MELSFKNVQLNADDNNMKYVWTGTSVRRKFRRERVLLFFSTTNSRENEI